MTSLSPTLELACQLISRPSITPRDEGCQSLIAELLKNVGFDVLHCDFEDTLNLFATRGHGAPHLVFAGHTDVVPPGPNWKTDPFIPTLQNGRLIGRGAADMKGALAAIVHACLRLAQTQPQFQGSLSLLITSDEEGSGINGTRRVIDHLKGRGVHFDYCVVGEATSKSVLGDEIKPGRRGSLQGDLTLHGRQGHVAYPSQAVNAIHQALLASSELTKIAWEQDGVFERTSLQITHLSGGSEGLRNVIPGVAHCQFNIRYAPSDSLAFIQSRIENVLKKLKLDYQLDWTPMNAPFYSRPGLLLKATLRAIQLHTGLIAQLSTAGGTSDGRHFAVEGVEVIELGPLNETIHAANEQIWAKDLDTLSDIYESIARILLISR